MAENLLKSQYINRLLKATSEKTNDLIWDLKDELYFSCGLPSICYRSGKPDKPKYLRMVDVNDLMNEVGMELIEDFDREDNEFLFLGLNGFRSVEHKDLSFETPISVHSEKELKRINLLQSLSDESLCQNMNMQFTEESVKAAKAELKNQKELRLNGYHGKYPAINKLYKNTLMYDNNDQLAIMDPDAYDRMWSYIETNAYIAVWLDNKKIYRVSNALEEDFIEQKDLAVPHDALKYLPFRSFVIDLSENEILGKWFDCAFATVSKNKGDYKIDFKVFDSAGILANSGFRITYMFFKGEDTKIDNDRLKSYTWDTIRYLDRFKEDTLNKAIEDQKNGKGQTIPKNMLLFQSVRPIMYKKLEYFLLSTIFYLCCSNKKVRKTVLKTGKADNADLKNITENTKSDIETSEVTAVEIEDLGFMDDEPIINFNEIDLNDDGEYVSSGRKYNKTNRKQKPHLVRGHYHHYRCGKDRQEVIYKYTKAYYTGRRSNIVSVTTIK